MARVSPTTMIFIPCLNGWSHRPEEFASPEHIASGAEVLAHTMAALAT
jgi:ureidoglycolate amidohydrolase